MLRKGFTLLELLIVMSIILVLLTITLPCLFRAKDSVLDLAAMEVGINEEGKVRLEISDHPNRKPYDDVYMIEIDAPRNTTVRLKRPHPSGMKLRRKDGRDYLKWRPKTDQMGMHSVTLLFEGQESSEQEITIFVYTKKFLEAQQKEKKDPH